MQSLSRHARPTPCVQARTQKKKSARGTANMGRSRKRTGRHIGVRHLRNASPEAREALQRAEKFQIRDSNKSFSGARASLFVSAPFSAEASPQ